MYRIFISHSSKDNATARALSQWLTAEGWGGKNDFFVDFDPDRGIAAGQRWRMAFEAAVTRCEAVLFLISKDWFASQWCQDEYTLAISHDKPIFALLVDDVPTDRLPDEVRAQRQYVRLQGHPYRRFVTEDPQTLRETPVLIAEAALTKIKRGLEHTGISPVHFPLQRDDKSPTGWRATYRGLAPLDIKDAAVFFGRDLDIIRGLDALRGLASGPAPRFWVVLGASGAGKSSYMRAGLWPRLERDSASWLPLLPIRASRGGAIEGTEGLLASLEDAHRRAETPVNRTDLRDQIATPDAFVACLARLQQVATREGAMPLPVLFIDQAEELFAKDTAGFSDQSELLLKLVAAAAQGAALVVTTIRSDSYNALQTAPALAGLHQHTLSLGPVPETSLRSIVREPAELLRQKVGPTSPAFDEAVISALLNEIKGEPDALPLLAFAMQRLMIERSASPLITMADLERTGGVTGAIETTVGEAMTEAGAPADEFERRGLLRRLFIPQLARVNPDTRAVQRRVGRHEDIPTDLRRIADELTKRRLLVTRAERSADGRQGETTIEVAHEALLRRWKALDILLAEDKEALLLLDGVLRAAADEANASEARKDEFRIHRGTRLLEAQALATRGEKWAQSIEPADAYLERCAELDARLARRRRANLKRLQVAGVLAAGALVTLALPYGEAIDHKMFLPTTEHRNWTFDRNATVVTAMTTDADGRTIAKVWQLAPQPNTSPTITVVAEMALLAPDGRHLAVVRDRKLYLYPTAGPISDPIPIADLEVRSKETNLAATLSITGVATRFSSDGTWLLAPTNKGEFVVFDTTNTNNSHVVAEFDINDEELEVTTATARQRPEFAICSKESVTFVRLEQRPIARPVAVKSVHFGDCSYAATDALVIVGSDDHTLSLVPTAPDAATATVTFLGRKGDQTTDAPRSPVSYVMNNAGSALFGRTADSALAVTRKPAWSAKPIFEKPRGSRTRSTPAVLWSSGNGKWVAGTNDDQSFYVWAADEAASEIRPRELFKPGAWSGTPLFAARSRSDIALLSNGRGVLRQVDLERPDGASTIVSRRLGGTDHRIAPLFDDQGWQAVSTAEVLLIYSPRRVVSSTAIEQEIDTTLRAADGRMLWASTNEGLLQFRRVFKLLGLSVLGLEWPRIQFGSATSFGDTTDDGGRVPMRGGGDGGGDGGDGGGGGSGR